MKEPMVNVNHLLIKATIDQRRARDRALRRLLLLTVDHRLTDWQIATSLLARHSALAAQKRVINIYINNAIGRPQEKGPA